MTYATQASLTNRFGPTEVQQISDVEGTGVVNVARIDQILSDVDNIINSYLASRYTLPLAAVPAGLEVIACDIARYLLMSQRPTEEVTDRHKMAIKWLEGVAAEKIDLGLDATNKPVADQAGAIAVRPGRPHMDRRTLAEYDSFPVGTFP
jgi:phage gp36-like protein